MGFRPLKPQYTSWVRRRSLLRWAGGLGLLLAAGVVALDRLGCFGYDGDDWRRFDGRSFPIARIIDGQSFVICTDEREETVALLGVDAAATEVSGARQFLSERLAAAHRVTLKLEPIQTRDSRGRLIAWAYLADSDCLNVDLVRAGLARADARVASMLRGPVEAAQVDARKHHRGLWAVAVSNATTTAAPR